MGRGGRREERQWQRELEAQLRALPTYEGETPDGGPVEPLPRALPEPPRPTGPTGPTGPTRARRRRSRGGGRERRRTLMTVVATVTLIAVVLTVGGPGAAQVKSLLGWDGRGDDTAFAFLQTTPLSGDPVTWSSCEPIRYVVNPAGAPDGWQQTVTQAMDAVTAASGLRFEAQGTTDDRGFENRVDLLDRPGPVLIGWASVAEQPRLEGDTVGFAGPRIGGNGRTYVTGGVVLDAAAFERMEARGNEALERAVVMHELGHLVGLDHVDDDKQLMYPTTTFQTTFGNGDLEGLKELGDGPCR